MPDLDYGTLRWLHGLVAQRIHRNEKALAKFSAKGEQTAEEAAAIRAEFERNLAWQRTVLARIDELENAR